MHSLLLNHPGRVVSFICFAFLMISKSYRGWLIFLLTLYSPIYLSTMSNKWIILIYGTRHPLQIIHCKKNAKIQQCWHQAMKRRTSLQTNEKFGNLYFTKNKRWRCILAKTSKMWHQQQLISQKIFGSSFMNRVISP